MFVIGLKALVYILGPWWTGNYRPPGGRDRRPPALSQDPGPEQVQEAVGRLLGFLTEKPWVGTVAGGQ